jgi:hypothetical protein
MRSAIIASVGPAAQDLHIGGIGLIASSRSVTAPPPAVETPRVLAVVADPLGRLLVGRMLAASGYQTELVDPDPLALPTPRSYLAILIDLDLSPQAADVTATLAHMRALCTGPRPYLVARSSLFFV